MTQHLRNHSTFRVLGALAVTAWVLAVSADTSMGQAAPQPAGAGKSVNEGVYSAAQAERGKAVFNASCTTCHETTAFTSDDFLTNWTGKPLSALFDHVSTTMPEDNPGSLKPQQYADVISFVLELNEFPAGTDELKGTPEAMKAIKFERKAK